ncbi:MAG: hypothetical protein WKF97_09950 [Chitinophagaceae bacterium]
MVKRFLHSVSVLLLSCSTSFCFSQTVYVKATIDKDRILIGEQIRLQLEANVPMGFDAKWFMIDSIPHFEFVEQPGVDTLLQQEKKTYKQVLTITSFDSGRWVIPALALEVNGKSYLTDTLPVLVAFSEFDPAREYHDIKDILEVENPYAGYINWALAALTLLSFLALGYFLRKQAPQKQLPGKKDEPVLGPFEEAMSSLEKLHNQQLPRQGLVKQYYTGLNDILRLFISRKVKVVTMQKTNEELIMQVKQLNLPHESFIQLAQTLRMSDAVKFAKFNPENEDNELSYRHVKTTVELINELYKE